MSDARWQRRWQRVDALFAEAAAKPEAERGGFLAEACGGDDALRREVEDLLAADRRSGSFLEGQADELFGLRTEEEGPGRDLGPYRLLERIGEGGAGRVFLAERRDRRDQLDGERFAIKILRHGLTGTPASHRFLHERAILANLRHPHVARLLDSGTTPDGRPFLVMEHVRGLPLTEHCDRHRLPLDRRLELFARILDAVDHAHQHFLIHRDLKPSHLLVDERGEPKLLDFGIAKQLKPVPGAGTAVQTAAGLQLMTPVYASPEQVRSEPVTVESDVYALGVVLYELLTGCSPYRLKRWTFPQVIEAILHQEPQRPSVIALAPTVEGTAEERAARRAESPSSLSRRLAEGLEPILLTTLDKDPHRRFGSVPALARALEAIRS